MNENFMKEEPVLPLITSMALPIRHTVALAGAVWFFNVAEGEGI